MPTYVLELQTHEETIMVTLIWTYDRLDFIFRVAASITSRARQKESCLVERKKPLALCLDQISPLESMLCSCRRSKFNGHRGPSVSEVCSIIYLHIVRTGRLILRNQFVSLPCARSTWIPVRLPHWCFSGVRTPLELLICSPLCTFQVWTPPVLLFVLNFCAHFSHVLRCRFQFHISVLLSSLSSSIFSARPSLVLFKCAHSFVYTICNRMMGSIRRRAVSLFYCIFN